MDPDLSFQLNDLLKSWIDMVKHVHVQKESKGLVLHQVSICFRSETVLLLWPLESKPSHAGPLSGKLGMDLGDSSGSAWTKCDKLRTHQFDYFAWRTLIKLVVSMLPFCIWILEENGWNFIFRIHLQPASLVWAAPARCKSRCSNEALVARAGWMPLASRAMAGSLPLPNPWRRKNIQTWTLPGSCALWRLLDLQKNVSIKFMNLPSRGIWVLFCWGLSIFNLSFLDEKTKHCEGSLLSRQGQKTASWSGQLRRQPMFHLASSSLGSTGQCYTDCTIQQSSTAKNHRLLMPTILSLLPPCPLPGMECTTTTKGMVTSGHLPIPVASKSTKLSSWSDQHGNQVEDPLETNMATENGKRMKNVEAELGFCWERPPFFRCQMFLSGSPLAYGESANFAARELWRNHQISEGRASWTKQFVSFSHRNDGLSPPDPWSLILKRHNRCRSQ